MAAVTLLYRKGYFYQRLDASGRQSEQPVEWVPEDFLVELQARVSVTIEDRPMLLRVWRHDLKGITDARNRFHCARDRRPHTARRLIAL
jgi:starch phosphorylase